MLTKAGGPRGFGDRGMAIQSDPLGPAHRAGAGLQHQLLPRRCEQIDARGSRSGESERVLGDSDITDLLSKEEIDRAFSLEHALRNVDAIYRRTLEEAE